MTFDIKSFRAFRIHRQDRQVSARFDDIALSDLTAGDVAQILRDGHGADPAEVSAGGRH